MVNIDRTKKQQNSYEMITHFVSSDWPPWRCAATQSCRDCVKTSPKLLRGVTFFSKTTDSEQGFWILDLLRS